jgi:hypothetical protein
VLNGGITVSGANVSFTMSIPGGSTVSQNVTSGANGTAAWNYRLGVRPASGNYSVVARATTGSSKKGSSSTQTTTSNVVGFAVQ